MEIYPRLRRGALGHRPHTQWNPSHRLLLLVERRRAWPLEAFPQSYHDACDSAVAILCPEACACQPGGDCCYHTDTYNTCFGPESLCPSWSLYDLCSSPFVDPSLIVGCEAALANREGVCEGTSFRLPDACHTIPIP